jgi:DNA-binding beta-propeller fold protein YncE
MSAFFNAGQFRGLRPRTRADRLTVRAGLLVLLCCGFACLVPSGALASSGVTQITLVHVPSTDNSPINDVAVDPSTHTVLVTGTAKVNDVSAGRVWIINGRSHHLITTLHLPGLEGDGPSQYGGGIAVDPVTDRFYVADPGLTVAPSTVVGALVVIDGRTHKVLSEIPDGGALAADVDTRTDTVFVAGGGYTTDVINGKTNTVTAMIGSIFYPASIGVDSGSDTAYVAGGASGGTDGVWVINGHTNTVDGLTATNPVTILMPSPPSYVAVNPKTGSAYVAGSNSKGGAVFIVHRNANRFAHTITIRDGDPAAIAIDNAKNTVYVANESNIAGCPGFVTELSGKTNKVLATVNGFDVPGAIAVDSATHNVFVVNGGKLEMYRSGYSRKQKKCGTSGVTV